MRDRIESEYSAIQARVPEVPQADLSVVVSAIEEGRGDEFVARAVADNVLTETQIELDGAIDSPRPFADTASGRRAFLAGVVDSARRGTTDRVEDRHPTTVANACNDAAAAEREHAVTQDEIGRREVDLDRVLEEQTKSPDATVLDWPERARIAVAASGFVGALLIEVGATTATVFELTGVLAFPGLSAPPSLWIGTAIAAIVANLIVIAGTIAVTAAWTYLAPSSRTVAIVTALAATGLFTTVAAMRIAASVGPNSSFGRDVGSLVIPLLGVVAIPCCVAIAKFALGELLKALAAWRDRTRRNSEIVKKRRSIAEAIKRVEGELETLRQRGSSELERMSVPGRVAEAHEQGVVVVKAILARRRHEVDSRVKRAQALLAYMASLPIVRREKLITTLYTLIETKSALPVRPPAALGPLVAFLLAAITSGGLVGCSTPRPQHEVVACDISGDEPACDAELVTAFFLAWSDRAALIPGSSWRVVAVAGSAADAQVHTITAEPITTAVQATVATWRDEELNNLPVDWFKCTGACKKQSRSDLIGALSVVAREIAPLDSPVRLALATDGWLVSAEAGVNTEVAVPSADSVVQRLKAREAFFSLANVGELLVCGPTGAGTTMARANARDALLYGILQAAHAPDFQIEPTCGVRPDSGKRP